MAPACLFPSGSTTPKPDEPPKLDQTFGSYVAVLRHEDAGYTEADGRKWGGGLYIGQLQSIESGVGTDPDNPGVMTDSSYGEGAMSGPDMPVLLLSYFGIADGRICFGHDASGVKTYDSGQGLATDDLAMNITIEVHDDLAAVAARPLQPSPGVRLDSFEVTRDEIVDKDSDNGTIYRERQIEWRLCGPAPAITPQARYLTATFHDTDSGRDGLLLWEVAGAPSGQ